MSIKASNFLLSLAYQYQKIKLLHQHADVITLFFDTGKPNLAKSCLP